MGPPFQQACGKNRHFMEQKILIILLRIINPLQDKELKFQYVLIIMK